MQSFHLEGHGVKMMTEVAYLYKCGMYMDCTFAVEGQYLKAHKLILSASSPYFQELFNQKPEMNPIILKNVKYKDLKSLVDLIYFGNAKVPNEHVPSFVNTAKSLLVAEVNVSSENPRKNIVNESSSGEKAAPRGSSKSPYNINPERPVTPVDQQMNESASESNDALNSEFIVKDESMGEDDSDSYLSSGDEQSDLSPDPNSEEVFAKDVSNAIICKDNSFKGNKVNEDINLALPVASNVTREEKNGSNKQIAPQRNVGTIERLEEGSDSECLEMPMMVFVDDAGAIPAPRPIPPSTPPRIPSENPRMKPRGAPSTTARSTKYSVRKYACHLCGKAFRFPSDLNTHMRVHTGERPFACMLCPSTFSVKSALKTHLRTHTGEKPFPCDHCPATFTVSSALRAHLRLHSGEKPYICKVCGACFNGSSALKNHQLLHSGEKAFKCSECAASFATSGYLRRHSRVHEGLREFRCLRCTASFHNEARLTMHMKVHLKARVVKPS